MLSPILLVGGGLLVGYAVYNLFADDGSTDLVKGDPYIIEIDGSIQQAELYKNQLFSMGWQSVNYLGQSEAGNLLFGAIWGLNDTTWEKVPNVTVKAA